MSITQFKQNNNRIFAEYTKTLNNEVYKDFRFTYHRRRTRQ